MRKIEWTHNLTWKTLYGKNHGSTRLRSKTMHREVYNGELQGDDLELAVLATGGGNTQRRRPLPLSLSLAIYLSLSHGCSLSSLLLSGKTEKMSNNIKTVCPKSYLYTYDFGAIYNYSLKGPWQTYSQICPRIRISLRVHSSSGSEAGVFIIRFRNRNRACRHSSPTSDHPIRRDRNPNKLPLHFGMGCLSNPILFRHASSLSGVSTLVSISEPFSSVWIFVSTNSLSSILSRIQ